MSQPIFPKGTKVVKGKVVQRLQGSSQVKEQKANLRKGAEDAVIMDAGGDAGMRAHFRDTNDPDFLKAVVRLIQEGRTGPRLAPGQQSKPKASTQIIKNMEEGRWTKKLGDPRKEKELPKNKPGRIEENYGPDEDGYVEPSRMIDLEHRSRHPEVEGRGASPLSKIIEAMRGEKMPAPLLEQLKGLDPVKLEEILALITRSKYGKQGERATGQSNAARQREKSWSKQQEEDYNSPDDLPF